MRRTSLLFVVMTTLMAGAFVSWADEAESKTITPEQLIDQLGSNDFAEREQAAKMLQERGPTVLPALRKAVKHEDAEVRRRVAEMIPILEAVAAVAPKRVTLTAEKRPLSAILKDIEKQTGYTVKQEEYNDEEQYNLEMKKVSFLEALERIRRETGCVISIDNVDGKDLCLKRSRTGSPLVVVKGAFRLELTRIHEDRDVDFLKFGKNKEPGQRSNRLTLGFSVLAEPKYLILSVEPAQMVSATDEEGKVLTVAPPLDREESVASHMAKSFRILPPHPTEMTLQRSSKKAQFIKALSGTIAVHIVVERKSYVVTKKVLESEGTKYKIGSTAIEITRSVQSDDGKIGIDFKVPTNRDGVPSRWLDRFYVEDDRGNRFVVCSKSTRVDGFNSAFGLCFCKPANCEIGPPEKLIIEDWTVIRYPISFVLEDIPLP